MITSFEKFALFQFFRQLHFTILQSQIDLVDNDITINVSKLLDLEMMNLQSFFLMYFLDKSELASRPPPPPSPLKYSTTMIPIKLRIWKTKLNHINKTLQNCCVSCSLDYLLSGLYVFHSFLGLTVRKEKEVLH